MALGTDIPTDAERLSLPERRSLLVDDAHRVDNGPGAEPVERTRKAERHDLLIRQTIHPAETDQRGGQARAPTRACLGSRGAG